MSWLYIIYTITILFSLIANGLSLKKNSPVFLKAFFPFLLVCFIVELITYKLADKRISTIELYNIFSVLEFCFYLWFFYSTGSEKFKKIYRTCLIVYPIIALTNMFYVQKFNHFHSFTYGLGSFFMILFSISYFFNLFNKPKYSRLYKNPAFWITSGILFFYTVSFPIFIMLNFIGSFSELLAKNIGSILLILNIFLYLLFSIAFLCNLKTRKSIS